MQQKKNIANITILTKLLKATEMHKANAMQKIIMYDKTDNIQQREAP